MKKYDVRLSAQTLVTQKYYFVGGGFILQMLLIIQKRQMATKKLQIDQRGIFFSVHWCTKSVNQSFFISSDHQLDSLKTQLKLTFEIVCTILEVNLFVSCVGVVQGS